MMKFVFLLVFIGICFAAKLSNNLMAEFDKHAAVDFCVHLSKLDYTKMTHNGKSYSSLDRDSKAHFIFNVLRKHAAETQREILQLLQKEGAEFTPLWITNSVCIKKGSNSLASQLSLMKFVQEVDVEDKYDIAPVQTHETVQQTVMPHQQRVEWNLEHVKAPEVWKMGYTGKRIVVGMVDTGCNLLHPSLLYHYRGYHVANSSITHDFHWFDPSNRLQEPSDTQDHGSHCTGTVLGSTSDKSYITGAAHDAQWIHCHFVGTFAAITRCFEFMMAPHDRRGQNPNPNLRPHVTSHSYGGVQNGRSQLEEAGKALTEAGVAIVVAAHNYGRCRSVADPGILPFVLTVGALGNRTNVIASFSSRGPNNQVYDNSLKPEISAPGTAINSASGRGLGYSAKSGTSMATPLVAGAIALLWEAVPALNREVEKTYEVLFEAAHGVNSTDCESSLGVPNNVYGHGVMDIKKAVDLALKKYGRN